MDTELLDFISHLDDDVQFSPYQQLNEMWRDLEDYFDRSYFDIDQYLNELLPDAQPRSSTIAYDIPIEEPPQVTTVEKLLQSFAIPETFFNDLIPNPVLEEKSVVTNEILLNSIRSCKFKFTGRQYKHPFDTLASDNIRSVAPIQNKFIGDIEPTFKSAILSNVDWFPILHKQKLYPGITAEDMARNILQSTDQSQKLPTQTEIVDVINLLFIDLNDYIDSLSAEFRENKFLDAAQFDVLSQKIQKKISDSNAKSVPLRDALRKWMGTVTETFRQMNDRRRQVEEKVSKKIIDRAVEIYRDRLMSLKQDEDMSIASKKQSDIVFQGIRHAYLNCGEKFIANVLKELQNNLQKQNSFPEKLSIPRNATSNDSKILIELLVSEYASNINQKGLQCASISTLKQFDDVNGTCMKDILHSFDRKMIRVAGRNELKKQLLSKLESESNSKRSEFKQRSLKATVPTGESSLTRSHSVGIHFGFETISVSCFDQLSGSFRTIYGPVANFVSFAQEEVFIGRIPNNDPCTLNIAELLENEDANRLHDTKYHRKLKLESIIALMLMYIDEIVKRNLHSSSTIKYAMAIPSRLDELMQQIFKTAFNIAEINCSLVREQCAITANFIRETHQPMIKNADEFVMTMIVMENKACDSVVYNVTGEEHGRWMIEVSRSGRSEAKSEWFGLSNTTGVKRELEKMKNKQDRRIRFVICGTDLESNTKEIKNMFAKSKVHPIKFDSIKIADGAALLSYAAIEGNSIVGFPFDLRSLTSIKQSTSVVTRRLTKNSLNAERRSTEELRSIIDSQFRELAESKAAAKQFIMGKMKDLEESHLSEDKKEVFRRLLQKNLKAVDDESINKLFIEKIADYWKANPF